jgi:hypothetical protein
MGRNQSVVGENKRWNWQWRIHCIVKAVEALEKMAGYAVMSHETGSQQLKSYAGIQYPNIHQKHQFIKRYKH